METFRKLIAFLIMLVLVASLTACKVCDYFDDTSETEESGNLSEGNWVYAVSSAGEATLLWGDGAEKSENVVMIPAELGGYPVTDLGNGEENVLSNNKTEVTTHPYPLQELSQPRPFE